MIKSTTTPITRALVAKGTTGEANSATAASLAGAVGGASGIVAAEAATGTVIKQLCFF